MPEEMPAVTVAAPPEGLPLPNLLKEAGLVASTSEALRMIRQGAVRLNGERVEDGALKLAAGSEAVYQVGKRRFARVRVA
jgi:tyrosyl-tRNA synthetase